MRRATAPSRWHSVAVVMLEPGCPHPPGGRPHRIGGREEYAHYREGGIMTDKSPRKTASKKSGKSLKEKRQAKKDKEQTRKGLTR
jgi:hypothetical protein